MEITVLPEPTRQIRNKAARALREMADRLETEEYASEANVTIDFLYDEVTKINCHPALSPRLPTGYLITIKAVFPRKAANAK